MKKTICLVICVLMLLSLCACGGAKPVGTGAPPAAASEAPSQAEQPAAAWTRAGYFMDENENMISVTRMDDIDEPGWYVGVMLGEDFIEDSWGGTLPQEGDALHGSLASSGSKAHLTVTVSEEGEDGLLLTVEGGETYHFTSMGDMTAGIIVTVNTEGRGMIGYEEGETVPELDPEWPYQSAQVNLGEPETYTFAAAPEAGSVFVRWTKNGEDFSAEPVITVLLDESADFVAVFEEEPGWQNPVMNFIGEYQSGRAHALVECSGYEDARITIEWGDSARETTQWDIFGRLDTDTLTITYSRGTKRNIVYDDSGDIMNEETVYEDGTGTVVFREDGTFVWHEDLSESGEDMLFEWLAQSTCEGVQMANPWRDIPEAEAERLCPRSFHAPDGAENVKWSVLDPAVNPSDGQGSLVQLSFDLYGNSFTAREQITNDPDADISGMYYDWTVQSDDTLRNWPDAVCHSFRSIGDGGYADLCSWYDAEHGISYCISVTAEDLDGFDLLAIAEALGS